MTELDLKTILEMIVIPAVAAILQMLRSGGQKIERLAAQSENQTRMLESLDRRVTTIEGADVHNGRFAELTDKVQRILSKLEGPNVDSL